MLNGTPKFFLGPGQGVFRVSKTQLARINWKIRSILSGLVTQRLYFLKKYDTKWPKFPPCRNWPIYGSWIKSQQCNVSLLCCSWNLVKIFIRKQKSEINLTCLNRLFFSHRFCSRQRHCLPRGRCHHCQVHFQNFQFLKYVDSLSRKYHIIVFNFFPHEVRRGGWRGESGQWTAAGGGGGGHN